MSQCLLRNKFGSGTDFLYVSCIKTAFCSRGTESRNFILSHDKARKKKKQVKVKERGNTSATMSDLVVCDVEDGLKEKLRKFRFRKETNNAAIIMKIDKMKQLVVVEEEFQDISPDELKDELPEREPRFVVYSYKYIHDDGRISYPLCFIFSSPAGCKPEQQMMYAGSKTGLVLKAELTKVFEIRNTEELTEEWLKEKLSLFR
nr:PREDICTED: glia maturation factor gamma isoform X1 [Latimeria chalumnae]|eukprot:XP_005987866.2 PREDICTED: glia maturation factor gamma isoform X1 [Latimeria chalumnae]